MAIYIVQRYCAKNDTNGNPRRVFVIRDDNGNVVRTVNEGYTGPIQVGRWLLNSGLTNFDPRHSWDWQHSPDVTYLGDVDVSPGVYRRMVKYQTD